MENKYLEKIASMASVKEGVKAVGRDFAKGWKRSSLTSKVGLGMSATGLGLGVANYKNSVENKRDNKARQKIDAASLETLKGISESLKKKPKVTVNLRLQQDDAEKQASLKDTARAAGKIAAKHPFTVGLGTLGAADGALKTTHQKNESHIRTVLRGVRNTAQGAVVGAGIGALVDHGRTILKNAQ